MSFKTTRYGFKWGPALVERTCSDPKWGVVVTVRGLRESAEIRVTPSGLVKVEAHRVSTPWDKEKVREAD